MALDVWFRDDILGALRNTAHAHGPMGEEAARVLEAVALSFHILPEQVGIEPYAPSITYDTYSGPRHVDAPLLPYTVDAVSLRPIRKGRAR